MKQLDKTGTVSVGYGIAAQRVLPCSISRRLSTKEQIFDSLHLPVKEWVIEHEQNAKMQFYGSTYPSKTTYQADDVGDAPTEIVKEAKWFPVGPVYEVGGGPYTILSIDDPALHRELSKFRWSKVVNKTSGYNVTTSYTACGG